MGRKQEVVRPYFEVVHEHDASLKALLNAASMLHSMVTTAITLADTPEKAMRLIANLKQYDDAYSVAAHGRDPTSPPADS